jgi:RNA polymerase sigma-70 factor (family 1)
LKLTACLLETSVLIRLREGDKDAFKEVYEMYSAKLFRVSRRFGLKREDANEVVQEVFIKVWERRQYINIELSFNAYILMIAKNLIIKKARSMMNEVVVKNYLLKENNNQHNETEDMIIYADLLKIMDTFMESLPPQQRTIFKLNKLENYSSTEISTMLDISKRTVENHLFRASNKLKGMLKSMGILIG